MKGYSLASSLHDFYTDRIQAATGHRDALHRTWSMLGNIRLIFAIVAIVGVWQSRNDRETGWLVTVAVGVVGFIVLAVMQRRYGLARDAAERMVQVSEFALAREQHRWADAPLPPDSGVDRTHPYAHDLNIVGEASVAQRLGTPATDHGWKALYAALLTDQDVVGVADRQRAIAELAGAIDLRQAIESEALATEGVPDATPLIRWAHDTDWLRQRRWLRAVAVIGPLLVVIASILVAMSLLPWVVILVPVTLNAVVFMTLGAPAAQRVQAIVPTRDGVAGYSRIMANIASSDFSAPMLRELNRQLSGAHLAMEALSRIVNFAIPPGSMLYFPLQMTLMWDINVLDRLEHWRTQHGTSVETWLNTMGEWEALAALSVLTHDHPEWSTPSVDDQSPGFAARALGHPLIDREIAVSNDVDISPAGQFLFVTGSNMSGKSTLLRAIGVNAVLAQAGASVFAESLTMPPLRISSCMRVEDSLAHGVSFFMAELLRLKSVVDHVQQPDSRMSLYLLDEILQGTNTAERQIASRHILQQLSKMHAIGAVSSHDLELIDGSGLESAAIPVHFAEQFTRANGAPDMTFDYRLRPGIATSSNAIRLMELIGFDIHE